MLEQLGIAELVVLLNVLLLILFPNSLLARCIFEVGLGDIQAAVVGKRMKDMYMYTRCSRTVRSHSTVTCAAQFLHPSAFTLQQCLSL